MKIIIWLSFFQSHIYVFCIILIEEAGYILEEELAKLNLPGGLPSLEEIDDRRQQQYGLQKK